MASMAESQLEFEGTNSDFQALEEKVYRTIELLKEARKQKASLEQELTTMRQLMDMQSVENEDLQQKLKTLQSERSDVRTRVEKLMGDVDAILEP